MAEPEDDPDGHPSAAEEKRSKHAAEVVAAVGRDAAKLSGEHTAWLAEIRRAPQEKWVGLVNEVLDHSLDLKALKARVAELKAETTDGH